MSIKEHAKDELQRCNFGDEDTKVMIEIIEKFLDQWDSGGAVSVALPVFNRLIACKPLTPLTGEDDEWYKPIDNQELWQNKRCSTVFKDAVGNVWDIASGQQVFIRLPYEPPDFGVPPPVMTVRSKRV
jgi:hypothetical protein